MVAGNLQSLIDDVEDGADVKVVVTTSYGTSVILPTRVWTANGSVYVQGDGIGVSFDASNNLAFKYPDDYYYFTTFDTKGRLEASRYKIDGTALSNNVQSLGAKWFTSN